MVIEVLASKYHTCPLMYPENTSHHLLVSQQFFHDDCLANTKKKNYVALVLKRTIPIERPPLVGEF
jgi:hypothetical protein